MEPGARAGPEPTEEVPAAVLHLSLAITLAAADALAPGGFPGILESQELADGLDLPLGEEAAAYEALGDDAARRRFRTLFWTRRDPDPETFGNAAREELLRRAREADGRFSVGTTPGRRTSRGRTFVLMGPPDHVESGRRYQRWSYEAAAERGRPAPVEIVFEDRAGTGDLAFAREDAARAILDAARRAYVKAPSVAYADVPRSLPAPDVAGVEWQEMLLARDAYRREGRASDFSLLATLNATPAGRGRSSALLDVDLRGDEVVRPRVGAGDERHVTVAGLLESEDLGISVALRDLAVLRSPADRPHIRIPFELQPGTYHVTLLAREPLLGLHAFREEVFTIPDHDGGGLACSSLMVGRAVPADRAGGDLPLSLRAGDLVLEPTAAPGEGSFLALVHVRGSTSPAGVRLLVDDREVPAEALRRSGTPAHQVVAASIEDRGKRLVAIVTDPAAGRGIVLVRDLGDPASRPMASRRARLADLAPAPELGAVTLVSPREGDNPIGVTRAAAERPGGGAVGIFVGAEMQGLSLAPPHAVPVAYSSGGSLDVAAAPLDGLASGIPLRGLEVSVSLPSRTIGFRVRTTLVPLYVAVEDRKRNRFVADLPREAFAVQEDGRPQRLEHFERDTRDPLTVAFLLDESRNMAPFQDLVRAAMAEMASQLRPVDEGLVVGFNRHVALRSDVTGCKGCLVANILGSRYVPPGRETAEAAYEAAALPSSPALASPIVSDANPSGRLMDALEAAVFRLATRTGRKIVLVASHGNDSGSRIGGDRIADLARRYGVMIYAMGLNIHRGVADEEMESITTDPSTTEKVLKAAGLGKFYEEKDARRHDVRDRWEQRLRTPATLEAMAGASGGRAYLFDAASGGSLDLPAAIRALRNELAHQYYLGFYASEEGARGLRQLVISVPGKDYHVRGRSAYVPQ